MPSKGSTTINLTIPSLVGGGLLVTDVLTPINLPTWALVISWVLVAPTIILFLFMLLFSTPHMVWALVVRKHILNDLDRHPRRYSVSVNDEGERIIRDHRRRVTLRIPEK